MPTTSQPRRLRLEPLEHREIPAVLGTGVDNDNYLKSKPTDWDGTDNRMSLREAIRKVNKGADSVIDFNGQTVLRANDVLPEITRPVTIKNGTYDGRNWAGGLWLYAGGTVRDMTVIRSSGAGVGIFGTAVVENNFLGTDAAGTPGLGNDGGVTIYGNKGIVRNNVVSGNDVGGVGVGGSYNKVVGNKIGVLADGVTPLPNGGYGISIGNESPGSRPPVGNVVGGLTAADRNVIVGFDTAGVSVGRRAQATRVVGNYIGLTAAGTVPPGGSAGDGIYVRGPGTVIGNPGGGRNWIAGVRDGILNEAQYTTVINNVIGLQPDGSVPADRNDRGVVFDFGFNGTIGMPGNGYRNIISGNAGPGVYLNTATHNKVQNNWIGLDLAGKAGTAAVPGTGNGGAGIRLQSAGSSNDFGGAAAGTGNVIAGNEGPGLWMDGEYTYDNRVLNNTIGLDASGAFVTLTGGDRGNRGGGILIGDTLTFSGDARDNRIGAVEAGNVIAGNTGFGIRVEAASGNTFAANAIYDNTEAGISLAAGANADIGRPVLLTATPAGNSVLVTGVAATRPSASLTVQLFGSPTARADGRGEGARFLGTVVVTTDATGAFVATFPVAVPAGFEVLTITVTDAAGNTSEFSDPVAS